MNLRSKLLAVCAGVLTIGCLSEAAVITIGPFPIDGTQEVPPNASTATGSGVVTLDTTTNDLSWIINWSGTTGPLTAMHFHGNAGPGANAGVVVNIGGIGGTTSPSVGKSIITAAMAADLQNGLWYVNLHTAVNPGGELRGQLVSPPPACDGDANGDGAVDVNDISYVLFRLGNACP